MTKRPYRLIDTAGSELAVVEMDPEEAVEGSTIDLPDGGEAEIIEIYDDEHGREGGVTATLVVDA